jgi:hypothetical protein
LLHEAASWDWNWINKLNLKIGREIVTRSVIATISTAAIGIFQMSNDYKRMQRTLINDHLLLNMSSHNPETKKIRLSTHWLHINNCKNN